MPAGLYPCVVRGQHFEVMNRTALGRLEQTSQRLHRTRDAAERHKDIVREPGDRLVVVEYDAAYHARCGVCGAYPEDDDEFVYSDWPGVQQCIAASPGWSCTSEQLVFCPDHRPDKED